MVNGDVFDFQTRIQDLADDVVASSGIELTVDDILQILFFIQYQTPRVNLDRVRSEDAKTLSTILDKVSDTVKAFYKRFLHDEFQINSDTQYRSQVALLPLLFYYHVRNVTTVPSGTEFTLLKQYFVLSQINDWALQSIVSSASKLIETRAAFPFEEILERVRHTPRSVDLSERGLLSLPFFSLKLLLPKKAFTLIENRRRLNPELEHVFPRNPREKDLPDEYDVGKLRLWNLQLGVPGDINSAKGNKMPKDFFQNRSGDLQTHYDFLPSIDINTSIWDYRNVGAFWRSRRELMLTEFQSLYKLEVHSETASQSAAQV
jgi:hypothetical protein